MGRALIAVGSFLVLCLVILAGAIYLTRDEDTYAVDNVLSERLTRAVAEEERESTCGRSRTSTSTAC